MKNQVACRFGDLIDPRLFFNGRSGQTKFTRQIAIDGGRLTQRECAVFEDR